MRHALLCATAIVSGLLVSGCVANQEWANAAQTLLNTPGIGVAGGTAASALTSDQISQGLREALRVGTQAVVAQLGQTGGFNLDNAIRIPLPPKLASAHAALAKLGLGGLTQDLENRMNEAAEQAVPEAKELFMASIRQMTIADARQILSGQQDAATQYLRRTMGPGLAVKIEPIIQATLAKTGAMQAYDRVTGQYAALPFVSGVKSDMNAYVTQKAMDGVFYYVAQEEAAIRANPAKRTTEILRTVFGGAQ